MPISVLNIELSDEYLKEVDTYLSAHASPCKQNIFKFRDNVGVMYMHPLLDDIFFTKHCLQRYDERKEDGPKSGLATILERYYPERYVCSGKKNLDNLVHSFVIAVLNSNLEYAKGKDDAVIVKIGNFKMIATKHGPFFVLKTFMDVKKHAQTVWSSIPLMLDPYKALIKIFKEVK